MLCKFRFASVYALIYQQEFSAAQRFPQLDVHCSTVSVNSDTLCMKIRQAEIAVFNSYEVDFILESLCVCWLSVYCLVLLFSSSFNCVLLYDIHFKKTNKQQWRTCLQHSMNWKKSTLDTNWSTIIPYPVWGLESKFYHGTAVTGWNKVLKQAYNTEMSQHFNSTHILLLL